MAKCGGAVLGTRGGESSKARRRASAGDILDRSACATRGCTLPSPPSPRGRPTGTPRTAGGAACPRVFARAGRIGGCPWRAVGGG